MPKGKGYGKSKMGKGKSGMKSMIANTKPAMRKSMVGGSMGRDLNPPGPTNKQGKKR
ncbi:MAG: hypothetical protein GDA50_04210 [Alphaproteobacteria bacterium GM202ARS2]|nr:hypothetical protein [Alphaproteobacteria bacterium GM202ARS2]